MQEILISFGIDWRLIVIQVFNFAVLMGVLWYFLYTPVLKLLAEREAKIKKGVEDAERAESALSDANNEKMRIIGEAHTEAAHIVSRGTLHAEEKERELFEEASLKAVHHIKNAELRAEDIKSQALKESESEIAKLAILGAERILNRELSK